jgi:putative toxin-antitoxin system antitoxin component (TIGR02293 family)
MPAEGALRETPATETDLSQVACLLGGQRWPGGFLESLLELHDLLVRGLPASALNHFTRRCPLLAKDPALDRLLCSAPAPSEKRRGRRTGRLTSHESGQLWLLATVVVRAAPVFGGIEAAQRALVRPAIGLDRRRPLDLLATPAGAEMVSDYLTQLEHGVYI